MKRKQSALHTGWSNGRVQCGQQHFLREYYDLLEGSSLDQLGQDRSCSAADNGARALALLILESAYPLCTEAFTITCEVPPATLRNRKTVIPEVLWACAARSTEKDRSWSCMAPPSCRPRLRRTEHCSRLPPASLSCNTLVQSVRTDECRGNSPVLRHAIPQQSCEGSVLVTRPEARQPP